MSYGYYKGSIPKSACPETFAKLAEAIPFLESNDKGFALSLHDGHVKYGGWSDKQEMWANKMIAKAMAAKAAAANPLSAEGVATLALNSIPPTIDYGPAPVASEGEMAAIHKLFANASEHLKKPVIKLNHNGLQIALKKQIKNPENISVVSDTGYPNKFYGTIKPSGQFHQKFGYSDQLIDKIKEALSSFAADPAGVAAQYGKMHGKCCFCNKGLSDEKSTSVGYGPICAQHYGLPWGSTPSTLVKDIDKLGALAAAYGKETESGNAALKKLAESIVNKKIAIPSSSEGVKLGLFSSQSFSAPKGELKEMLKAEAEAAKVPGEKVMPVLSSEEYERMRAKVEILF
jgi:hypothetical protein